MAMRNFFPQCALSMSTSDCALHKAPGPHATLPRTRAGNARRQIIHGNAIASHSSLALVGLAAAGILPPGVLR